MVEGVGKAEVVEEGVEEEGVEEEGEDEERGEGEGAVEATGEEAEEAEEEAVADGVEAASSSEGSGRSRTAARRLGRTGCGARAWARVWDSRCCSRASTAVRRTALSSLAGRNRPVQEAEGWGRRERDGFRKGGTGCGARARARVWDSRCCSRASTAV